MLSFALNLNKKQNNYIIYWVSDWFLNIIFVTLHSHMDTNNTIYIPNVAEEARIGSSFNYLIKVISETRAIEGKVLWYFNQ